MTIITVVRVKADSKDKAIELVNNLLTDHGEYSSINGNSCFDSVREDTYISEDCKTQKDFNKLVKDEEKEYKRRLGQSEKEKDKSMRGYYLSKAGECLDTSNFWSTERLAYDMASEENQKGKHIYFIDTYRHA